MNAAEFVQNLAALMPGREALAAAGLRDEDMSAALGSYVCAARECQARPAGRDAAIALVDDWDASRAKIGMVQFLERSLPCPLGTQIGVMEVDPLVVTGATGEVVVVDENEPAFVMCYAAENGARFLDALIVAAQFLEKRARDEIAYDDFAAAQAAAKECSAAAGGPKYENFYRELLSADP